MHQLRVELKKYTPKIIEQDLIPDILVTNIETGVFQINQLMK